MTNLIYPKLYYTFNYFRLFQMGGSDSKPTQYPNTTIVANDWDFPVYAKVQNEKCLVLSEFHKLSLDANGWGEDFGFGMGFSNAGGHRYKHYTKIPGLTKIAPNTMLKYESQPGKPMYVTIVTAHKGDYLIARNFRYDPGNVMLVTEDGCLMAIDGQNLQQIQQTLDD